MLILMQLHEQQGFHIVAFWQKSYIVNYALHSYYMNKIHKNVAIN